MRGRGKGTRRVQWPVGYLRGHRLRRWRKRGEPGREEEGEEDGGVRLCLPGSGGHVVNP